MFAHMSTKGEHNGINTTVNNIKDAKSKMVSMCENMYRIYEDITIIFRTNFFYLN